VASDVVATWLPTWTADAANMNHVITFKTHLLMSPLFFSHRYFNRSHTPGKPEFVVCEYLCCVFYFRRTAKRIFVVCFLHSARRKKRSVQKNVRYKNCLPCIFSWSTTNIFPHQMLPSFTTVSLCVIFVVR
jgi:hypothetical protein